MHPKKQATITWVPRKRTYHITCLSKNGMVVNGKYKAKGGVGEIYLFYFIQIEQRTRTVAYGPAGRTLATHVLTPRWVVVRVGKTC